MKRFALILAVFGALAVFGTVSANAADNYYGHGYSGRASYGHGYSSYGRVARNGYIGHGYTTPTHGYGAVQYGYRGHGYAAPAYRGHSYYRSYGHGGGVRVATPYFGLQIGH